MTWSRRPPFGPAGQGWVKTCPSGMAWPGWSRRHCATAYGTCGMRVPRMNDSPAASICFWLASLTIPASATTVTSGRSCAAMNDSITGSIVLVSALLPSNADHQREAVLAGEQAYGDLRLEPPLLRITRLAEPVALIGLDIQGADVVEDQARPAQPGVRGARRGQLPPERVLGIDGKAALERGIRRAGQAGFLQHPQAVGLADRLDDPRQHQLLEDLVAAAGRTEAQHVEGPGQGIEQAAHPRRGDRQRPARRSRIQAQVQLALPGGQPLPRDSLQQLQLHVVMCRADVLDLPRPAARGVHNLHRDGARRRLHRPHIRHPATLRPPISAQIQLSRTQNKQVTASRQSRTSYREPTQVTCRT